MAVRKRAGQDTDQEPDEPADGNEALVDQITEKGTVVYSLEWDSGGLGAGAGEESVYEWNRQFAVTSLDYCEPGPFNSLEEAITANSLLFVNSATVSITCSLWSAPKLAKQLECDEDGCRVSINGQLWIYSEKGGFTRSRLRGPHSSGN
jgi:hypothetical protein